MRPLVLSLAAGLGVLSVAWAQTSGGGGAMQQLPVGQTFKQFEFPYYQNGQLKYTAKASEATGVTLNRAAATDLQIQIYDNGAVTTTITSPKADLYVNEEKMRSKDTVRIVRTDQEATAQSCDFDLKAKKYLLRTNVKVVLKNFSLSLTPGAAGVPHATGGKIVPPPPMMPASAPMAPRSSLNGESMLDSPGAYANTNSVPLPPTSTIPK